MAESRQNLHEATVTTDAVDYLPGWTGTTTTEASRVGPVSLAKTVATGTDSLTAIDPEDGLKVLGVQDDGTPVAVNLSPAEVATAANNGNGVYSAIGSGAVGDGSADDTSELQAGLTAAAGGWFLLEPNKTYKISSGLSVPANTWISAYGATISAPSGNFSAVAFTNGGGIFGATITGPGNATYNDSSRGVVCAGTNNAPSAPTFVQGPKVIHCSISEFRGYGVRMQYCNRPIVEKNKITGIGYAAFAGLSCNDGVFDYNEITDVTPGSGSGDAYGVFWDREGEASGSETTDPRSYRCSASYNKISGVTGWEAIDSHGGIDMQFVGNDIWNCKKGIVLTSSKISNVAALGPQRGRISNNAISIDYDGVAISVGGAFNGSSWVEYASGVVISGNTINGSGLAADNVGGSIIINGTKNVSITGNTINEPAVFGINVYSDNLSFTVTGNTIVDPFDNSVTVPSGVAVRGNNNKGVIADNTFRYQTSGLGTYVAVGSIYITTGLSGTDILVGRNGLSGIASGHLEYLNSTEAGVNTSGSWIESGSATIAVANTGVDGITDVAFTGRAPATPKSVSVQLRYPFNQGGKFPIVGVDTSVAVSQTGFRMYAKPADNSAWTASGNLSVFWTASL